MRFRCAFAALLALSLCCSSIPANALSAPDDERRRTPTSIRNAMNAIYADWTGEERLLVDRSVPDSADGFDFCGPYGDPAIGAGPAVIRIHGTVNERGCVEELAVEIAPADGFSEEYGMESDMLMRMFTLSAFPFDLGADAEALMRSYLLDIRPYRYKPGDSGVGGAFRAVDIWICGGVAHFDSAAFDGDKLQLRVTYLDDPDAETAGVARANCWRAARMTQAITECEVIAYCGETLSTIPVESLIDAWEDVQALFSLMRESMTAYSQLQIDEYPAYADFSGRADALCADLQAAISALESAREGGLDLRDGVGSVVRLAAGFETLRESLY